MHPDAGRQLHAAPSVWAPLVARQSAVVTRRQLARRGVGRERVRAAVVARRWQTFGRDVVVLHNGALTERQRWWVAVLLLDQPTALAGPTAARAAGLTGFDDDRVHIVVDRSCAADLPPWVTLHASRRFSAADVLPGDIPRTRPSRSVVDAASWSTFPRRACAILCAAVQQKVTTTSALVQALRRAGQVRHVAIMRSVLGDIGGGGHTLAEIELGGLARRAGLPPPRRQVLRRERSGRVRYVDAEFDLPDGSVLVVEIDGAVHLKPLHHWDDLNRQNEIVLGGRPVLRFDSVSVRLDAARVVGQLRRFAQLHAR